MPNSLEFLRWILFAGILFNCTQPNKELQKEIQSWEQWKDERLETLKSPSGFVNLAGLFWLDSGVYTMGSDPGNDLVLSEDADSVYGSFIVKDNQIEFIASPGQRIMMNDSSFQRGVIYDINDNIKHQLKDGNYIWYVIERAGNLGLRVKNLAHPNLKKSIDIDYYQFNPKFQVKARFEPYVTPRQMRVVNVIGHTFELNIRGKLVFEFQGKNYSLEPIDEGDQFFIIFSDETSAIETYGSGRYMYANMPEFGNEVVLDFNRSYNPPCAFTKYATCYIPPPENQLDIRIEAGEKDYHLE
jgi:hypothetical protein